MRWALPTFFYLFTKIRNCGYFSWKFGKSIPISVFVKTLLVPLVTTMESLNLDLAQPSTAIKFIEEIGIIVAAKNLTPTMVSQDFLKFSGIIPQNWELAQEPILNPTFAQLNFQNGIGIIAQPRTITVSEGVTGKVFNEIQSPLVIRKYIEKLPHAEYQALSFSSKIIVPFANHGEAAYKYITKTLLAPGSWQEVGKGLIQAGLNLVYQLERCQLTLSISEARLQQPQQEPVFALLFAGSFNYNTASDNPQQRLDRLAQGLNFWQTDLQTFREIVNEKFLEQGNLGQFNQEESIFPIGALG